MNPPTANEDQEVRDTAKANAHELKKCSFKYSVVGSLTKAVYSNIITNLRNFMFVSEM